MDKLIITVVAGFALGLAVGNYFTLKQHREFTVNVFNTIHEIIELQGDVDDLLHERLKKIEDE